MCEGNQTWTLPRMDGLKIADFTIKKQGDAKGKLFFFLRAPYQVLSLFSLTFFQFLLFVFRSLFGLRILIKNTNSPCRCRHPFLLFFGAKAMTPPGLHKSMTDSQFLILLEVFSTIFLKFWRIEKFLNISIKTYELAGLVYNILVHYIFWQLCIKSRVDFSE